MTLYEDALAAHSRAVDAVFSERWTFLPWTAAGDDVNARGAPDPERPPRDIAGAYLKPYARAFSAEARRQGVKPELPGHASARPQIDFDARQLPYAPRRGDRLRRLKTGELFHIAEPKFPSAGTRLQVDLNLLNREQRENVHA